MTDTWHEINWYAIQTKPSRDDLAVANVKRLGVEVFAPKIQHKKWTERGCAAVIKSLFPSYFFAKFSPAIHLHAIRYGRGIRRVVSSGRWPASVPVEVIESIRSRVCESGFVHLSEKDWQPGDRVTVLQGPLRGFQAVFERELDDQKRVILLLDAIHYQARILVEKHYLAAAV
jgi:transcriptional antiterminator RfaH